MTEEETFQWFMRGKPPITASPTDGCWDWTGNLDGKGYGCFGMGSTRKVAAHIASHRIYNGPIPPGFFVLHSCDRPICVQPLHLHLGTPADNMRERDERNRTAMGESHSSSKLSAEQVREIRRSTTPTKMLARSYGVDPKTVRLIRQGKTWRHILP